MVVHVGNGSTSPTSGCGLEVKVIDLNSLHCVVEEIAPIHRLVILTSQNNECFFLHFVTKVAFYISLLLNPCPAEPEYTLPLQTV